MSPKERPVIFECAGERLVGIAALPTQPSTLGALIVVGGPQYRAGSHRQFVHLARSLARAGYPTFRFDCRGMGDSEGTMRNFEQIEPDIHAAVRAFRAACPEVKRLVAFGLCDAASAILMSAGRIDGLAGMVLANPWVRRAETLNAAVVRHYYRERLFSAEFWSKLASGKLPLRTVTSEFLGRVSSFIKADKPAEDRSDFVDRMRSGWLMPIDRLLLLSGRDLTAREFEDARNGDARWAIGHGTGRFEERLTDADHTFSAAAWREEVSAHCIRFLSRLANPAPSST